MCKVIVYTNKHQPDLPKLRETVMELLSFTKASAVMTDNKSWCGFADKVAIITPRIKTRSELNELTENIDRLIWDMDEYHNEMHAMLVLKDIVNNNLVEELLVISNQKYPRYLADEIHELDNDILIKIYTNQEGKT